MEENVFEIQKKAENGDAYYQHEMGVNYQYGYGVPVDKQKSMEWFQKAADNGNSESMRALGIIYECGLGVDKDPGKAFDFFQKSVEAGTRKAWRNWHGFSRKVLWWRRTKAKLKNYTNDSSPSCRNRLSMEMPMPCIGWGTFISMVFHS